MEYFNIQSFLAVVVVGVVLIVAVAAAYWGWVYFTESTFVVQELGFAMRRARVWDAIHQWHQVEWFAPPDHERKLWGERPKIFAIWPHGVWP